MLCKQLSNKFEIVALAAIGLRVNVRDLIKQGKAVSLYGLFIGKPSFKKGPVGSEGKHGYH